MLQRLLGISTVIAVLVITVAWARAEQPECTGNRHYDGVACCPVVECPPADPCPEVERTTCQPVICECPDGSNTVVQVNRCPTPPVYAPCRERKDGKARDGDVIYNGRPYKCPKRGTPHRFFVPQMAR